MTAAGDSKPLRVAFMGTPDFAVPALEALIAAGHDIAAVYTQPPRPAGRGQKLRLSPVQRLAEGHGLPVRTPQRLKDMAAELAAWRDLGLDAAVVVAYGLLLPKDFLDAPRMGCINIHASLLPRWRGAAPIHRAILAGDDETGVSLMQMEEGLDTGPILAQARLPIGEDMGLADLHDRLAQMGADLLIETLPKLAEGRVTPRPQPEDGVTYAAKIDKAEARIDWSRPAVEIARQVRAMTPFPGAWTMIAGKRVKILRGEAVDAPGEGKPGTVLDPEKLIIACGTGAYRIGELQREGRGVMAADAFLRGARLTTTDILE